MTLEGAVRASLWITAPANLAAAAALAFPSSLLGSALALPATHPFYAAFSGSLVALFGVCYAWLATQPQLHVPLLVLGACGKFLAVLTSFGLFLAGHLPGVTAAVISIDLAFAGLWAWYLLRKRLMSAS